MAYLVNLALSLVRERKRVGLLDADLFGPSLPRMMNLRGESSRPLLTGNKKIKPVLGYGIECMSMGLLQGDQSVVWRGLMVQKGIEKLLFEVQWGVLDYLVIDLPPGTGDTHLTLCQEALIDGVVIVSTPQEVALSDAYKAAQMFKLLQTPLMGVVENMAEFVCPHCQASSPIFAPPSANEAITRFCREMETPLLASFPLDPLVCSGSDEGLPLVLAHANHAISQKFTNLARSVMRAI